ncbi:alpha/beta fold hydrolase [Actinomadura sp. HBU206391]|uniref:alpha/beta fold hydrolase n=1 Tax=Actinomadura sp. HBU206391 TaxID=2731692 RepID=UPI00164F09BA|nr:alpha/beta hydrolase [Actinomadura sp. HBU206391]MBC6462808.1 alpha/beta hydrolase [Actinomadura sp. HBU206391]
MTRRIRRFSLEGVSDAEVSVHPFVTEDDLRLTLSRFHRADSDDVVLLLHGLTSSSDLFIMPEINNLVSFLLDNGFGDVWACDFRMSNHFPYNTGTRRYSLDDIAHYDYPAALGELRRHVGERRIHVFAHCLGALSFSMSLFGGMVDDIASLAVNSVSLTPRVPGWSRVKMAAGPAFADYVLGLPYIDPRFKEAPAFTVRRLFARTVSLFHPECRESACHMQSFMWASGRPGFFMHENLAPETHVHDRLADLNGASTVHYYRHIRKMVRAGRAVRYDVRDPRHAALPEDFLARAAEITTPVLFMTGDHNRIFTDSNVVCHELMSKAAPDRHDLAILPGYGHIDPVLGKRAYVDVYPKILAHLQKHSVERETA